MKEKYGYTVLFLIIGGLLVFILGLAAGIFYVSLSNPEVIKFKPAVNILSTKVIQTVVAYGRVDKIEGTSITLSSAGDSATIKAKNNAQVFSNLAGGAPGQSSFSEIRIGDMITMSFTVDQGGKIEADKIFIFSRPTN